MLWVLGVLRPSEKFRFMEAVVFRRPYQCRKYLKRKGGTVSLIACDCLHRFRRPDY
ncbi:MAG: hypothetical protein ACFNVM_01015 [Neisseria elongata]